jgi:hemolysin activation/secretion protein
MRGGCVLFKRETGRLGRFMTGLRVAVAAVVLIAVPGAAAAGERILPPAEDLLPERDTIGGQAKVVVRAFRFEGNTVFSDEELAELVQDYVGREVTSEELHEVRRALTLHYVNHGYVNSGAVLPDQRVSGGVIVFRIVEGELSEIEISGNRWTHTGYIARRVALGAGTPLNLVRLKDALEVMRQKPIFERLNADLQPGSAPGQSRLLLEVEEARPYQAALEFSNDRTPSVGAERFALLLSHRNLTGVADSVRVRYGLTENRLSDIEFAGLDDLSVTYSRPVTDHDTTLIVGYERTDSLMIEEPFRDLDITSRTTGFRVGLRHPVYRTAHTEFALSLMGERRENRTELMGRPFSFSPGAEDGESDVAVLRFGQEWVRRDERRAIAVRSTFSLGLSVLGATDHGSLPDSEFLAWLGQVQVAQRIGETNSRVIARLTTQLTGDRLLSLEQFSLGGLHTVRGYRQNEVVRDNAALASVEVRVPVIEDPVTRKPIVELAPFLDFGYGWDAETPHRGEVLSSGGVGVLVNLHDRVDARVYWGAAFRDFDHAEHDIQDSGLHFSIIARGF